MQADIDVRIQVVQDSSFLISLQQDRSVAFRDVASCFVLQKPIHLIESNKTSVWGRNPTKRGEQRIKKMSGNQSISLPPPIKNFKMEKMLNHIEAKEKKATLGQL